MPDKNSELKKALKKDFNKLYVKQFSTSWETERLVRDTEIEIMSFDNLEKLIEHHTTAVLDRVEYAYKNPLEGTGYLSMGHVIEAERKRLK